MNQTTSSSSSSDPESPPYLILSSDPEYSDPNSPTLAQIQAQNLASQQPTQSEVTSPPPEQTTNIPSEDQPSEAQPSDLHTSDITPPNTSAEPEPEAEPEPLTLNLSPPTSSPQTSEPNLSVPTLEEAIMLVAGASVQKVKSLTINSEVSDDPDSVRTHWNRVIGWMTSEAFKLKNISEQVRNGYIRDAEARLQERLAREAEARRLEEERLAREAEEEARRLEEERAKEAEAKALADAAAAAEAEAQAAAEAEAKAAAEAQQALTQGESSSVVPMVLQTLEELKKDQKELRARMDKQDTVNDNIQNMLAQLLQRMPPPPNP
jgi:hypothetical protein